MKWIKKWSFLILLAGMGLVYLSVVDHWKVYAESFDRARKSCQRLIYGEPAFPGNVVASTGDGILSGNLSEGTGNAAGGGGNGEGSGIMGGQSGDDQDGKDQDGKDPDGKDQDWKDPDGKDRNGEDQPEDNTNGIYGDPSDQDGESSHRTEDGFWDGSEPVYMTVEDDYFADAVFIGDSRTVGLYEYGGLEETAAFYASKGLTVYKLFDEKIVEVPGQRQKLTVEDALQNNEFKKIYLMVGINEMGTGTVETFVEKYKEVVDHLLELQPNAILYIQGILKVTTERSKQGDYINNEGIVARNEALAELADNRRIFYLDANPLICDDTGGMVPSYTTDGVHLKALYIQIWKDYLKEHAIDLEE